MTPLPPAKSRRSGWTNRWALLALPALLTACGGGGGDSSPGPASLSAASLSAKTATVAAAAAPAPAAPPLPAALAQLGQQIFNDPNLSVPPGTSCAACHQASQGGADNHGSTVGVALGSLPTSLGLRTSLMNAYSANTPPFGFVTPPGRPLAAHGGLFWDGRVDTLEAQALLPLLNPIEMNNPSATAVVAKVAAAAYAGAFRQAFGPAVFNNPSQAFTDVGLALQAFEQTAALQPFTSKFDAVVTGKASFSAAEQRGLTLFTDPKGANCAGCHKVNLSSGNPADSLFTDFTYMATGIPRNTAIPDNANPTFFDLGLCGPERTSFSPPAGVSASQFCGMFRMPSLRNVALRQRFMHNGFFTQLTDVVNFYSTRVSDPQRWYGPSGIPNDLPTAYLGNLQTAIAPFNRRPGQGPVLSADQVSDLVAFLGTLSDGYTPP